MQSILMPKEGGTTKIVPFSEAVKGFICNL